VETVRGYLEWAVLPELGQIQVSRLTAADLDHFYRRLLVEGGIHRRPYAPSTIRRVHGIVRRALTQGVRWGWISSNPAIAATPPRVPHQQRLVLLSDYGEAKDQFVPASCANQSMLA
jgi:hypothetical protein